jgi:hypothetical protein
LPSLCRRKSSNYFVTLHIRAVEELIAYYDAVAQCLVLCIKIEVSSVADNDPEAKAMHLHSVSKHCRLHFLHSFANIVVVF